MDWRLGRRPALDGLRAVAATLVVLDHARIPYFGGGGLGVDVFFVLSGFLITSLLIEELQATDGIGLPRFWLRRALRLLPAVWALVAVCWAFRSQMPDGTAHGVKTTLLYYTDWQRMTSGDVGALGHTWSLAIEEKFYLVWPVALLGLWRLDRSLRPALRLTILAAAVIGLMREVAWQTGLVSTERWYNGFDFRADGLLTGCALAIAIHIMILPRWVASSVTGVAGICAFWFVFCGRQIWGDPYAAERSAVNVASVAVIAALMVGAIPRTDRVLSAPPMRWVGARSYALYLWHYPICRVLGDGGWTLGRQVAAVGLSFVAAAASYAFVESPFLRLKDRLGGRPRLGVFGVEVGGERRPLTARRG